MRRCSPLVLQQHLLSLLISVYHFFSRTWSKPKPKPNVNQIYSTLTLALAQALRNQRNYAEDKYLSLKDEGERHMREIMGAGEIMLTR